MNWLDLSLSSPAENLALDEALLNFAESCGDLDCLRFWEPRSPFVVLGYANKVSTEVDAATCERLGIPVLRRCSGGGTVLQGPGVLNYSLVLRATGHAPLASITTANQFIMQRNADALTQLLQGGSGRELAAAVEVQGHTDLAIAGRKFSGNAQRRKRTHLLFHGAILLNLDLDLLDQLLPMPALQPSYRRGRPHAAFLTQLGVLPGSVKQALRSVWSAETPLIPDIRWPGWREAVQRLVTEKYSRADWNFRV